MAEFVHRTNSWSMFKAREKRTDRSPDWTGTINIEGEEYWINGWKHYTKDDEPYIKGTIVRKEDRGGDGGRESDRRSRESDRQYREPSRRGREDDRAPRRREPDEDDDLDRRPRRREPDEDDARGRRHAEEEESFDNARTSRTD